MDKTRTWHPSQETGRIPLPLCVSKLTISPEADPQIVDWFMAHANLDYKLKGEK